MQVPLELSFRNVENPDGLEPLIRRRVDKLEKFCDHITSCRVAVERPNQHARSGNPYRVRIDLTVPPGHALVVTKEPGDSDFHDELPTVVRAAFDAAERQLKELVDRQQRDVKTHPEPRALVVRMFGEEGYGFLKTPDGREVYFHHNSVVNGDWDRLQVGTQVRFEETMGDMGPQATTVQLVDKPGATLPGDRPSDVRPPMGWER
ncbi:MAG TPA: HPF/RaiA family ribosome-associated protein [Thermoanaerobaculia bacterium]|nr:HPF/RaiA family ribosome-associated protein [Thermoanaerobaculia bacterium]